MTASVHGKEYAGAIDHYLSSERRDAVKTQWEEPFSQAVFEFAVAAIRPTSTLRVLDVGCGIGDGLSLLSGLTQRNPLLAGGIDYVGLDIDAAMLETARIVHLGSRRAQFIQGDIREGVPSDPYDLYLSCGVPYSHLTPSELEWTLADIFSAIRRNRTRSAVIVDVLGRYSVEWLRNWGRARWNYQMTFFESDVEPASTDMSFYSSMSLRPLINAAAERAGCFLEGVTFHDRAVMVGRHSTTGDFNPGLPQYRRLVNSLFDSHEPVDLRELLFAVELPPAPAEVLRFYARFGAAWNARVTRSLYQQQENAAVLVGRDDDACGTAHALDCAQYPRGAPDFKASMGGPALARRLRHLETTLQDGLGVGHSLIAVIYADATATR